MEDIRLSSCLEECQRLEGPVSGSAPSSSSSSARIFRVPDVLKRNDHKLSMVYNPKVISLGPFHFLTPDLEEGEKLKDKIIAEAVLNRFPLFLRPLVPIRQARTCLPDIPALAEENLPDIPALAEENFPDIPALAEENFLTKIGGVCKEAYENEPAVTTRTEEMFVSMVLRDASFLLHVSIEVRKAYANSEGIPNPIVYQVVGPSLRHIWMDAIKLENQIPLPALEALYPFLKPDEISETSLELSERFETFVIGMCAFSSVVATGETQAFKDLELLKKDHLLHCLYEMSVSGQPEGLLKGSWYQRWSPFAWIRTHSLGCFSSTWFKKHCLDLKCWKSDQIYDPDVDLGHRVVASAVELRKAGLKFRPFVGGIRHLCFDETTCTLYLPRLIITRERTMVSLKNMMAFEWGSSAYTEKIVTSFVGLLYELIDTEKDVELLRRKGILVMYSGKDINVVGMFESIIASSIRPYYPPLNIAKRKMNAIYKKRKWKIMWSEFLEEEVKKPWVFVSVIAGTLLLVMTFLQVFCLFYSCNRIF